MESFTIRLAGQYFTICPVCDYIREYCRDYIVADDTEDAMRFRIATTQSDIDFEREKSAREDTKEGIPIRQFSDAYLETFVKFNCPEFTSLCPITGQPDFATVTISYVPNIKMVESKSLKLYLFSFRNHGDFHEDCMNIIMKDLIKLMDPKYIEVWGKFTPRGGISIDPYCNYGKPGTKWEEIAFNRMANHDMYPEKVDNR